MNRSDQRARDAALRARAEAGETLGALTAGSGLNRVNVWRAVIRAGGDWRAIRARRAGDLWAARLEREAAARQAAVALRPRCAACGTRLLAAHRSRSGLHFCQRCNAAEVRSRQGDPVYVAFMRDYVRWRQRRARGLPEGDDAHKPTLRAYRALVAGGQALPVVPLRTWRRVSDDTALDILGYRGTHTLRATAARYGVSRATVANIWAGRGRFARLGGPDRARLAAALGAARALASTARNTAEVRAAWLATVEASLALKGSGLSQRAVAARTGVSRSLVQALWAGTRTVPVAPAPRTTLVEVW